MGKSPLQGWQKEHPWEPSPESHPEPIPLVSQADLCNPMLRAGDILCRDAPTLVPTWSLAQAPVVFRETEHDGLAVVDQGTALGTLTLRNIVTALAERGEKLSSIPVSEVMTPDPATISPEATLDQVIEKFREAGRRPVLVVDAQGRYQGLIGWRQLLDHVSQRGLGLAVAKSLAGPPDGYFTG